MIDSFKKLRLVGEFIRKKREALRMSQRALGMVFQPPVSTQFISNVERGVTPLPPIHVPTLAKALQISESEIMALLEKEYAMKLNGRLGKTVQSTGPEASGSHGMSISVAQGDYEFMRHLYEALRGADGKTREAFSAACESILHVPQSGLPS